MKKWGKSLIAFVMMLFVFPGISSAAGKQTTTGGKAGENTNPFDFIAEHVKMRWDVITGLDFLLVLYAIALSAIVFYILFKLILDIFVKLAAARSGKGTLKDGKFWSELGITIVILFLFLSGTLFSWLGDVYNWTDKQDLKGKDTAAVIEQPYEHYV